MVLSPDQKVLRTAGRYRPHPTNPDLWYKCVITEAQEEGKGKKPGPQRLYIIRWHRKEEDHAHHRIDRHLERIYRVLEGEKESAKEKLLHDRTLRRSVRRRGAYLR